jgi:hypothetical protein
MRRFVLLPVVVLWLGGCSLPATSFEAYRSKAVSAAKETVSQAETAILTVELSSRDRLLGPSVPVQLESAERASAAAVGHFASVQPPDDRSEDLRRSLLPLLQETSDLIARMRFAASRYHEARLERLREALEQPLRRLEARIGPIA